MKRHRWQKAGHAAVVCGMVIATGAIVLAAARQTAAAAKRPLSPPAPWGERRPSMEGQAAPANAAGLEVATGCGTADLCVQ